MKGGNLSMRGSHLCHHHDCIVHVVYEAADIDNDRKSYNEYADKPTQRETGNFFSLL